MHAVLKPGRASGHNLLEVIVASTILCTMVVFMLGLWSLYHSALNQSKNRLVATSLARSVLEQRVAGGYGSLTMILNSPQVQTTTSRSQVRGRFVNVDFKTTFLAKDSALTPDLRNLQVTVEWTEDSGPKSLTYETVLFKTQ